METVLLNSESKEDMKILLGLAKRMGIKARHLSEEDKEEMGMSIAIKKGRTGSYVDPDKFLKNLEA